jgi:hypothetical protein
MKRTTLVSTIITTLFLSFGLSYGQAPQIKPKPIELKLRWLQSLTLNKAHTIGGSVDGDITATVKLLRPAINNIQVTLFLDGAAPNEAGVQVADGALAPMSVTIPARSEQATFRIHTFTSARLTATRACTIRARYGEESVLATFKVEPLQMASLNILPAAGFGPFTANGTVTLNARPASNQTVTLTSSNSAVGFGSFGNIQPSHNVTFTSASSTRTFQVFASSVSQPTTVTITARLGGQTLTRQITVRPAF